VTVHYLFGSPEVRSPASTADGLVQRCRAVLARHVARDGIGAAQALTEIRDILDTPHRAGGPLRARELVRLADVVVHDVATGEQLGLLLEIFDGPAAREYAAPDLPALVEWTD
jgi:hypothetical protein